MHTQAIIDALKGLVPDGSVEPAAAADGMAAIYIAREHVVDVCRALRDTPSLGFAFVPDMTAVDYMPREPRFEVVLHLASLGVAGFGDTAKRLRVKVRVPGTIRGCRRSRAVAGDELGGTRGLGSFWHLVRRAPGSAAPAHARRLGGFSGAKGLSGADQDEAEVYDPLQLTPEEFAGNLRAPGTGAAGLT